MNPHNNYQVYLSKLKHQPLKKQIKKNIELELYIKLIKMHSKLINKFFLIFWKISVTPNNLIKIIF